MKRLDKRNPEPGSLRRLLRPGPRPWFRRPTRPEPIPPRREVSVDEDAGRPPDAALEFERLVARYVRMSKLRDRALAETHVGEDALSVGDELKATQHFASSGHYKRRATELEAAIQRQLERLAHEHEGGSDRATEALRTARQRLYGSPDADTRPEFA